MEAREQHRQRLIRQNRRIRENIEDMLADQAWWNEANPNETPLNVDADGMMALTLAWLDQTDKELADDMIPISGPSPRLAAYLESFGTDPAP